MGGAPPNSLAPVYPMISPTAGRREVRKGDETPPSSLPRLRRQAQVGFQRTPAVRELRTRFLVADRGDDDHVLALLPVDGRRHPVGVRELERVDDAQDLVEVPAGDRKSVV